MAVRSTFFGGGVISATLPESFYTSPPGGVSLVKSLNYGITSSPADSALYVSHQRSGGPNLCFLVVQVFGYPEGYPSPTWFVMDEGDELMAWTSDGSEWTVSASGAFLVPLTD